MSEVLGNNLGLHSGWEPGDDGWSADMNTNLRLLDGVIMFSTPVAPLNTPPVSPAEGSRYIIGGTPTGAWSGHAGAIAVFQTDENASQTWRFYAPKQGWEANVLDVTGTVLPVRYIYRDGVWNVRPELVSAVVQSGTTTEVVNIATIEVAIGMTATATGNVLSLGFGGNEIPWSALPLEAQSIPAIMFTPGTLSANQIIGLVAVPQATTIPANLAGTVLVCASTLDLPSIGAEILVKVYQSGLWANVGTISVDTAGSLTLPATSAIPMAAGDAALFMQTGTLDTTFGNFSLAAKFAKV